MFSACLPTLPNRISSSKDNTAIHFSCTGSQEESHWPRQEQRQPKKVRRAQAASPVPIGMAVPAAIPPGNREAERRRPPRSKPVPRSPPVAPALPVPQREEGRFPASSAWFLRGPRGLRRAAVPRRPVAPPVLEARPVPIGPMRQPAVPHRLPAVPHRLPAVPLHRRLVLPLPAAAPRACRRRRRWCGVKYREFC